MYLSEMRRIHQSGEASDETSYYPALSDLLNRVGSRLGPSVHCVLTPRNRGAGTPDGGLFLARSLDVTEADDLLALRVPERGALEVKGLRANLDRLARSAQVDKYLKRYGQVLITNYREFQLVRVGSSGEIAQGEVLRLAPDHDSFWSLDPAELGELEDEASEFLGRALLADAPLSSPQDLASFLAAYARIARARIKESGMTRELETLKAALEDALGLRFEGRSGDEFFRSALVQTLFYGVFASWVNWSSTPSADRVSRFSWRTASWTFKVPMVRVLFDQLATPRNLPAGLDEILDWTEDVFSRIDRDEFFERFERREAVQYFYEPFLQAYDPDLRRELGVWYTPPEVVRYMVARVHESLQSDLGIELGLADERVHVLDPCTGTGSFLIEALRVAGEVLHEVHGDNLVAQQIKEAALHRFHGFEILPAPFIITHLQLGLFLSEVGAPLEGTTDERPSVYLTNALTGWVEESEQLLPFEEFRSERQAAGDVKRVNPILVVIGNPPYNGFTGVGEEMEGDLVAPYKEGLSEAPWEITKNKLDDYYVRFFRVAERRIAEMTGRGIISLISNFGWLGDPSAVVMRRHLLQAFDRIYIDNLNGDSRETGKKTPDGEPDPSIFSSKLNPSGIQVGAAVSLLVRTSEEPGRNQSVMYRDLWGSGKGALLEESLGHPRSDQPYEELHPTESNWYRLRRWRPRPGYESWPSLVDLARVAPELGLNENRGEALVDSERKALEARMTYFLDEKVGFDQLDADRASGLLDVWSGYDAEDVRGRLIDSGGYDDAALQPLLVRPFDRRWAYIDGRGKLWNRSRPKFRAAAEIGSDFLLCRKRSPRALDGAAFLLSSNLADQHALHKDAYAIPLLLAREDDREEVAGRLFPLKGGSADGKPWIPNLSELATDYLAELGYDDIDTSRHTARALWLHALAVGYAPLYLEENGDAIRAGWPHIPLPAFREALDDSAALGARLAGLLDIGTPLPGLDTSTVVHLRQLGNLVREDGKKPRPGDLAVTAGWASIQTREQRSGAVSQIVMPGAGRIVRRDQSEEDWSALGPLQRDLLGAEVLDVYLSQGTYWRGIPEAAWNFKIGGFQVLRKWLSYRDEAALGRPLSRDEAREFQSIARRVTELVLLGPELDANYRNATGSFDQDALIDLPIEHR